MLQLDPYLADPDSRFATVALADTNGLLRAKMVSTHTLAGILRHGIGTAPALMALDPTDAVLTVPGLTDGDGDFHDEAAVVDRTAPGACPGRAPVTTFCCSPNSPAPLPRSARVRCSAA